MREQLLARIRGHSTHAGIVVLGYVGFPIAAQEENAGYSGKLLTGHRVEPCLKVRGGEAA